VSDNQKNDQTPAAAPPEGKRNRRGKETTEADELAAGEPSVVDREPAPGEPEPTPEVDAAPAPAPGKGKRKRRTEEAHAQATTEEPAVDEAARAALEVAEGEAAAAGPPEPLDDTPAVGEGHEPPERLKSIIESLIFAADKPVPMRRLLELTGERDDGPMQGCLEALRADYADRGVVLHEIAGGWQFRTNPLNAHWVQQLIAGKPVRLSRAQLETLAICAYRQPITRPEIDEIRGVDSGATLKLLLDRSLVRILGKKEEAGRPILYGTTREFLTFFNLNDLKELPTLREFYELNEDSMKKIHELDDRRAAEGMPAIGTEVAETPAGTVGEPVTEPAGACEELPSGPELAETPAGTVSEPVTETPVPSLAAEEVPDRVGSPEDPSPEEGPELPPRERD
jgi:segregation and condensation protein B